MQELLVDCPGQRCLNGHLQGPGPWCQGRRRPSHHDESPVVVGVAGEMEQLVVLLFSARSVSGA